MSSATMVKRAQTMVLWFESLPEFATKLTDAQIAKELHQLSPTDGWVHAGAMKGDAVIVRSVRRWVDRQRDGELAGYQFNTRRSGAGENWVHLRTKSARTVSALIGTSAQVMAVEQHERRMAEEIGRQILKFYAQAEEWFQLGDYGRSQVCQNAAFELDNFGQIKQATKHSLVRLGLSS